MSETPRRVIAGRRDAESVELGGAAELRFCDLRDAELTSADLELYGCVLGDTRLVSSKMRVTGCFGGPLVVARDSSVALTTSHTTVAEASGRSLDQASWPVDVVEAATELVEGGNNARTAAAGRLGVIGDADAAPLLAYALGDPEWDVRAAALEALERLRPTDPRLLEWMAARLGDESALVRNLAWEVLSGAAPENVILDGALDGSPVPADRTRAAAFLLTQPAFAEPVRAWLPPIEQLLDDPDAAVREAAVDLLGTLDEGKYLPLLEQAFEDPDARVRNTAAAVAANLRWRPAAERVLPLLADPDEDVRYTALSTLATLPDADDEDIERARHNTSPAVQELARELLERRSSDS